MNNLTINQFNDKLCSSDPIPGGGGASALVGALSASLCSMVGNLTTGKKKYAEYQVDIERIIEQSNRLNKVMQDLINEDARAFEPLSKAYGIPKDDPTREETLEKALVDAAVAPFRIIEVSCEIASLIKELVVKGSRLAISDVGVAASLLRSCASGAAMNVYINTKLMKNRDYALELNARTMKMVQEIVSICDMSYVMVLKDLIGD